MAAWGTSMTVRRTSSSTLTGPLSKESDWKRAHFYNKKRTVRLTQDGGNRNMRAAITYIAVCRTLVEWTHPKGRGIGASIFACTHGLQIVLNVLAILCDEVRCCYYTIVGTNDFLIHPVSLLRHSQIDYTNIETVIEFDDGFSAFILLDFRAVQMRKWESAYNILNYALK